jgi:hypothetical protein
MITHIQRGMLAAKQDDHRQETAFRRRRIAEILAGGSVGTSMMPRDQADELVLAIDDLICTRLREPQP